MNRQHTSVRDGCIASALQLKCLWKVQIWREQSRANEAGRSGGEYPRATTVFCKCEIATILPATGIVAAESKWCASCAWRAALSDAIGALQQFTWFTGALGKQFAPQQSLVEQAITGGTLKLRGRRAATKSMARMRTTTTVSGLPGTGNLLSIYGSGRSWNLQNRRN